MPQNYDACFPATTPPTLYTGTGTATAFATGFPSLKQNDVVVFTGDNSTGTWTQTPQTDYVVNSQNANNIPQVVFNTAPGQDVLIIRRTDLCELVRTFQAGQSIRAQDLNNAFLQQLYLHQEMYTFLEDQFGGPLIPDGSTLQGTFWNKTTDTIKGGQAWVADDAHIATTAAGDQRWLNASGGDIVGGDGITAQEANSKVTISQSKINPDPAGTYNRATITVDDMGRVTAASANVDPVDTNTTYGLASPAGTTAVRLTGSDGTTDDVRFLGGTGIAVTRNGSDELEISYNGGDSDTTYDLTATSSGANANINLVGSNGTTDSVTLAAGSNVSLSRSGSQITIASTASGGIPEAPIDGKQYARKNANWSEITGGGGGASVTVDEDPPAAAAPGNEGDLWWNEDDGRLYISYTDGNSSQWVDASPPGAGSGGAVGTLQQVTDLGNTTTNGATFGGIVSASNNNIRLTENSGGGELYVRQDTSGLNAISVTSGGGPSTNSVINLKSNGKATFNGQVDVGVGGGQSIGIRAMSSANGGGNNAAVQAQNTANGDLWVGLLADGTQTSRISGQGNAEFAGTVVAGGTTAGGNDSVTLNSNGRIFINRGSGNGLVIQQNGNDVSSNNKIALHTDGSGTFAGGDIVLNANGSGTFDGNIQIGGTGYGNNTGLILQSDGAVIASNVASATTDIWRGYKDNTTGPTSRIRANGSADFNGKITLVGTGGIDLEGIQFGSTDSGANISSQTLDDYEEGTWSPEISAVGSGCTYDIQWGRYIKIGKRVFCEGGLRPTNLNGLTGTPALARIAGLPFTPYNSSANTTQQGAGAISWWDGSETSSQSLPRLAMPASNAWADIWQLTSAATRGDTQVPFFKVNFRCNFHIAYEVA